ncbi:helix-turn-helix domain-containing protein [Paenarthrobacter nicotinovorans]|uniref:helix-turn-helix domain-containing protein n=1 Tax=Paenarthrobacter TaxID=1742992 RepID=UPI0037C6DB3F
MSEAQWGIREAPKTTDPEDVRVGETLKALLFRTEETEEGFLIRRPITHAELAGQVRTARAPRGVSRGYITQLCNGEKHLTNAVLYQIARYLGVSPIAIKRPDPEMQQQGLPFAA